jgi:hypothetical protein
MVPMVLKTRALLVGVVLLLALLSGCGDGGSERAGDGGSPVAGCLTPSEVSAEVNAIAEGIEVDSEEVERKQEAIAAVKAEAC